MKRGTLSIRPEKVQHKGRKEPVLLGPYPEPLAEPLCIRPT
jgi:hypothetical protein